MPKKTITQMITGIFPATRRSTKLAELERIADETVADLQERTATRRDRNAETRGNMQTRKVQAVCNSA